MATLLEKVQTLISANLHEMVDKALETNSVAVMKQYLRDAEDNLVELEDAAATVGGEVKSMERNGRRLCGDLDAGKKILNLTRDKC